MTITGRGGRSLGAGLLFLATTAVVSGGLGASIAAAEPVIPDDFVLGSLVIVGTAYVSAFIIRGRQPYLPWPRQLPARWLDRKRPYATAARYGTAWGLTFTTPVRTGSLLALVCLIVLIGSPTLGLLLFSAVGAVKAFPAALSPLRLTGESNAVCEVSAVRRVFVRGVDIAAVAVAVGFAAALLLEPQN
jgi:hypothetical protein